jgi:hypothetical protein
MPTLLLSARQTDDAQKLWRACIAEKWDVVRLPAHYDSLNKKR